MDDDEWLNDRILEAVTDEEDGRTLAELPKTFFWGQVLDSFDDESFYGFFGLRRYPGVLFSGAPGNGKHTTARALAASQWKKRAIPDTNVLYLHVQARDFPESLTDGEAEERVETLFGKADEFLNGEEYVTEYIVMIFDQMEQYAHPQTVLTAIGEQMELYEEDLDFPKHCFVIGISEDESLSCPGLLSKLFLCPCGCPGERQREAYLKSALTFRVPDWTAPGSGDVKDIRLLTEGFSAGDLARETEGFSYRQLEDFVFLLKMDLVRQGNRSEYENLNVRIPLKRETVSDALDVLRARAVTAAPVSAPVVIQAGTQTAQPEPAAAKSTADSMTGKHPDEMTDTELFDYRVKSMRLRGVTENG